MSSALSSQRKRGPNKKDVKGLTSMQRIFVAEMEAQPGMAATVAAKRAGYKQPHIACQRLLTNPVIKLAVEAALTKRITASNVTAEEIDRTLFEAIEFDPADIFEENATGTLTLKELQKMVTRSRRCITGVKVRQRFTKDGVETEIDVKWMDKLAAAKLLYQRMQLLDPETRANGAVINVNFLSQLRDSLDGEPVSPIVDGAVIDTYIED